MKTKSKILVIALIFAMLMLLQSVFANKASALTASEYKSVFDSILSQYEEKQFVGSSNPASDGYYGCSNCGYGGWTCVAFGRYVMNKMYGTCEKCGSYEYKYYSDINSISDLRVGDVMRFYYSGYYNHTVVIIDIEASNNRVRVMDCNFYNDNVVRQWYMSYSDLKNYLGTSLYGGENAGGGAGVALIYRQPGASVTSTSNTDTTAPTITDYYVDVSSMTTGTSYTVYAKATDNVGVTSVKFPTWTEVDGQDDLIWHEGTYNSSTGYWSYTVKSSEHLGGTRRYHTHIYAYDAAGNQYAVAAWDDLYMESKIQTSLGNFSARIVPTADTNYCIGVNGTTSSSLTVLKTKNQSTKSQIWVFTKNSDNTYTIKNLSAGLVLDVVSASVDANGSAVQLYSATGGSDQKYYIMNYNGGYRLVPASTKTCKAIDVYGATFADGTAIDIHNALNTTNTAQTFTFEKVATSLSISSTSATLDKVGATKTLTATISPSTVARKTLSWSSSNTSVAKVSSSGVVTAVGAGTATITVKTTDGTSLSKTCKITVTSPYSDASTSSWYYNAVKFMYDRGYMSGTTSTTFEPNAELTRGMLVSILYKMEGGPSVSSGATKFSDVTNSKMYYYSAVKWASEKGIVNGYADGTFKPNNSITREELAIMLNNYCRYKGKYDSTTKKSITSYADGSKVSSYAVTAMQWAVGNKIITSDSSSKINPKSYATRAEAASMIYKYCNYIK